MSAFIVDLYHIHRLVATALQGPKDKHGPNYPGDALWHGYRLVTDGPDALGQMLHDANVRSVSHLYGGDEQPEVYTFHVLTPPMTGVEALKALNCYEYQSSDIPDWQGSPAEGWCDQFRHDLIAALPGYDDAPWEQARFPVQAAR
jgi:hypothetical protein